MRTVQSSSVAILQSERMPEPRSPKCLISYHGSKRSNLVDIQAGGQARGQEGRRARRQAGKKTGKTAGRQAFQTSQTSMCTHHGSFKWNIDTPTIEKIYMTSIKKIAM